MSKCMYQFTMHDFEGYSEYIGLFFDIHTQQFMDENGKIVYNIYDFITPNEFMYSKHLWESGFAHGPFGFVHRNQKNVWIDLYFPEDDFEFMYYDEVKDFYHGN